VSAAGPPHLDAAQRRRLLAIARESMRRRFDGDESPDPPPDALDQTFPAASGTFVSLHRDEDLRGCVGTLTGDAPLPQQIWRIARSAAFHDPRFPPLQPDELPACEIEISVLTPLQRCAPDEVLVGRDGLCISSGHQRGVLLPQVPTQAGWDREQFLAATCRKARLPEDAWRDPAVVLQRFEAEVFSDHEPARDTAEAARPGPAHRS